MVENIHVERVLFIDIETVTQFKHYEEMPQALKPLWDIKSSYIDKIQEPDAVYHSKGAIYAEFGKIVCISVGYIKKEEQTYGAKIKSFFGNDEKQLLHKFSDFLKTLETRKTTYVFGGHNIREFDIPYICRRMLINGINLPDILNIVGKKPWEIEILDTMQYWKFGDYKNFTSLKLLCQIFNIKEVKEEMDGSDVGRVYWEENNLSQIVRYCQSDVLAVMQLLMKFKQLDEIKIDSIEYAKNE
jgi:DNA polymerase elongation subunit (family B)